MPISLPKQLKAFLLRKNSLIDFPQRVNEEYRRLLILVRLERSTSDISERIDGRADDSHED